MYGYQLCNDGWYRESLVAEKACRLLMTFSGTFHHLTQYAGEHFGIASRQASKPASRQALQALVLLQTHVFPLA